MKRLFFIGLLFLISSTVHAVAYVQGINNQSHSSITLAGVTTGHTLIMTETSGNQITAISDNMGNNWQHITNALGVKNPFNSDAWIADNVIGGSIVASLTFSNGNTPYNDLLEFSGVNHQSPYYGGNHIDNQNGTTDDVSPNLTMTGSLDFMVVVVEAASTNLWDAPWINILPSGAGGPVEAYYAPGVIGTYHATASTSKEFLCSSGFVLRANAVALLGGNTQLKGQTQLQ